MTPSREEIIEAAARALSAKFCNTLNIDEARQAALIAVNAVTPLIESATLEQAAKAFEPDEDGHDAHNYRWKVEEIAAAIRALKEQP